jgi:anti-anti-sigma regulatory factor
MAFNLFPKSGKAAAGRRLELADTPTIFGRVKPNPPNPPGVPIGTRTVSDSELGNWVPQAGRIEVGETVELSPSLENAALMFAHGNATAASAALAHALDTPERSQTMVWMCLFDLHCRSSDRAAFEELALKFVVQFERSAPAWDELSVSGADAHLDPSQARRAKPKSLLRGALTDPQAPVLAALTDAAKRKEGPIARFDLDIVDLDSVSDTCGMLLAGALAALRRRGAVVTFRGLESTLRRLSGPLQPGTRAHKGQWYLVLELLQWSSNGAEFEDRAVDFAVTFEISPPSTEALSPEQRSVLAKKLDDSVPAKDVLIDDRIVWFGELKGPTHPCLHTVAVTAVTSNPVTVDMQRVLRVDFVCGGGIANAFTRLMAQAIDVHVIGASPIIQTLLQLTGVPATLFVRSR